MPDNYDDYEERRMAVAAAALRDFDMQYGRAPPRRDYGYSGEDPYARPPPEYYSEKSDTS